MDILSFITGSEPIEHLEYDWLYDQTVNIKDAVHYMHTMDTVNVEQLVSDLEGMQAFWVGINGSSHYKVMKNGITIYDKMMPASVSANALWPYHRVTKLLTTFLVLRLLQEKGIDVNAPVKDHHFPELAKNLLGTSNDITFKHMLEMRSGLLRPQPTENDNWGYPGAWYWGATGGLPSVEVQNDAVIAWYVNGPITEPDEDFRYDCDLILLGIWIRRESGQSPQDYAYSQVFEKLSVPKEDFYWLNIIPSEHIDRVQESQPPFSWWYDSSPDIELNDNGALGVVCTVDALIKYLSVLANRGEFPDSSERLVDEVTWDLFMENDGFWLSNDVTDYSWDRDKGWFVWQGSLDSGAIVNYKKNYVILHSFRNQPYSITDELQTAETVDPFFSSYLYGDSVLKK